jgi:hypothetical protein
MSRKLLKLATKKAQSMIGYRETSRRASEVIIAPTNIYSFRTNSLEENIFNFLSLPTELIWLICDQLDSKSRILLSRTCKTLRILIKPFTPRDVIKLDPRSEDNLGLRLLRYEHDLDVVICTHCGIEQTINLLDRPSAYYAYVPPCCRIDRFQGQSWEQYLSTTPDRIIEDRITDDRITPLIPGTAAICAVPSYRLHDRHIQTALKYHQISKTRSDLLDPCAIRGRANSFLPKYAGCHFQELLRNVIVFYRGPSDFVHDFCRFQATPKIIDDHFILHLTFAWPVVPPAIPIAILNCHIAKPDLPVYQSQSWDLCPHTTVIAPEVLPCSSPEGDLAPKVVSYTARVRSNYMGRESSVSDKEIEGGCKECLTDYAVKVAAKKGEVRIRVWRDLGSYYGVPYGKRTGEESQNKAVRYAWLESLQDDDQGRADESRAFGHRRRLFSKSPTNV